MEGALPIGYPALLTLCQVTATIPGRPTLGAAVGNVFQNLPPVPSVLGAAASHFQTALDRSSPIYAESFRRVRAGITAEMFAAPQTLGDLIGMRYAVSQAIRDIDESVVHIALAGMDLPEASSLDPLSIEVDREADGLLWALASAVAIESDSTRPVGDAALEQSADWVARKMTEAGLSSVRVLHAAGAHPAVTGEWVVDHAKPWALLYAHHDVQPPGAREKWQTDPWEARLVGDRFFGRGVADDQAGIVMILGAIAALRRAKITPVYNIRVLVEGEEEIGSEHLGAMLAQIEGPQPAVALLADGSNALTGVPTIGMSTRGVLRQHVDIRTAARSAHSGVNTPAPSATRVLVKMLAELMTGNLGPDIPVLTARFPRIPRQLWESEAALPDIADVLRRGVGLLPGVDFAGDPDRHPLERRGGDFSMEILAIEGSQPMAGATGIIPPTARALLELRTPPGVSAMVARRELAARLRVLLPRGVEMNIPEGIAIDGWLGQVDHPLVNVVGAALARGYGRPTVINSLGGGIGFLSPVQAQAPDALLAVIGVEDPDTNAHAENESLYVPDLYRATRGLAYFLSGQGG